MGRSVALLSLAACLAPTGCGRAGSGIAPGAHPGSPPSRIVIDGEFHDWARLGRSVPRDRVTPATELDLRAVELADDPEAVFLRLEFREPVNVQGLRGTLSLALDVDGDSATGGLEEGLPGSDLVIDFTRRDPETGERRDGVAVRVVDRPAARMEPDGIGLMFEPRYAAPSIELRIARGVELPEGVPTFVGRRARARVVFRDAADVVRDEMAVLVHELGTGAGGLDLAGPGERDEGAAAGALARTAGTAFRVASWNVSGDHLLDRTGPIARILDALDPDVVLLDELPPEATAADVRRVLPGRRAGRGRTGPPPGWRLHVGTSGGAQRGAIAVRGALWPEPAFVRVPYPDSVRPWLVEAGTEALAEVARNADGRGVPAAAARIGIADRRILVVALDLVCCGNSADALEDRMRRVEAAALNAAVDSALRAARSGGVAPEAVLVAGDFNLVGSRLPLGLAAEGLDLDGSALEPVYALQLDGRSTATWTGRGGPFPPGRLDYVLYSGTSLRPLAAFAFETDDLSREGLARRGLRADDSGLASDHLPVVVDFAWVRPPGDGRTSP